MRVGLPNSFATRLTLANFITSLICVLIIVGLHLVHSYLTSYSSHRKDINHKISTLTADFTSRIEALRMDASFLASVPPIQGIRRAIQGSGKDNDDNSTLEQWKDRLAVIFKEMLLAKPHYLQLRLIGIENDGKELVRVEWRGMRLQRTTEILLQTKKNESYFKEAIATPPGVVYLSDFSLNREWGKVQIPPQLVIRAAVPIPDPENRIFAILVINMLAKNALTGLLDQHAEGEVSNVYDSKMESLITSTELGGWVKSNKSTTKEVMKLLEQSTRESPIAQGKVGDYHVVAKKIFYDPIRPFRFIAVTTKTPMDLVYTKVRRELSYKAAIAIMLVSCAMFILFISIQRQTRPLQALRDLASRLSRGDDVPRPLNLDKKDDELSQLALAFYDMADEIQKTSSMLNAQKEALDETALVSETDPKGRIIYANKKFAEIAGYTQDELIGSSHRVINSGFHSKEFFQNLWSTISSGRLWRGEVKNQRRDGSFYWVDSSIVPFKNKEGKIEKYISIRFDITAKKEQEGQLKDLSEAKAKFLAVMSHEIRTPLGAVIGLSELLSATSLSDQQREYVQSIEQSADMLLGILNDILDLSKLNSGQIQLHIEPTSVNNLGEGVINIFREKALENDVQLVFNVSESCPAVVEIDAIRFKQILINLVSNAIKFTSGGKVEVIFSFNKSSSTLICSVKDTGIGMTDAESQRVFDEFVQADSSTTKNYGGTGLGLPICQKIAAAMGGTIIVESRKGIGSTFTVELPVHEYRATNQKPETKSSSKIQIPPETKILLAEDNDLNQTIFTKMIEQHDLQAKVVGNGKLAMDAAENEKYDIIFLDIQMPVVNGMEACKEIKRLTIGHEPWIVALTANAFREDIESYRECGFDDYFPKPFGKKTLIKAFSNFTSGKGYFSTENKVKSAPSAQTIDFQQLSEVLGSGVDSSDEYFEKIRSEIQDHLLKANIAIKEKNRKRVIEHAHTAKGVGLGFGMIELSNIILRLEVNVKEGDWDKSEKRLEKALICLDLSINEILEHIKKLKHTHNAA